MKKKKYTAAEIKRAARIWASMAGSIKSPARAAASRRNGKLGGRPRKNPPPSV